MEGSAAQRPELERAVAVGAVTPTTARLWMRSPGGGPHRLELWPCVNPNATRVSTFDMGDRAKHDHTFTFVVDGLEPSTRYRLHVAREDGTHVGEGRFETAPQQSPERFTFAFGSCHQPFEEDGSIHPEAIDMLRATRRTFEETGVKFSLWVGDQMYADFPEQQSLFREPWSVYDRTEAEVLAAYHARYRWFWSLPEYRALLAEWPTYALLDDHEVIDNWGSFPEHHTPRFDPISRAALNAYRDYQSSRIGEPLPTGGFDFTFDYGPVSFYALDTRTHRRVRPEPQVFGDDQLGSLERWLNAKKDAPALFLVLAVPVFFMPGWEASLATHLKGSEFSGDAWDRWSHPQFAHDRLKLLHLLRAHQQRCPKQKLVALCGDVHVGYSMRCDWRVPEKVVLYHLVSSPITHLMAEPDWGYGRHVPRTHFVLPEMNPIARLHLMGGLTGRYRHPISALNVGVVDVDLSDANEARMRFRLFGPEDPDTGRPKLHFEVSF